jgi:glycerol-3-phosphate dehydrogenase
LSSVSATSSHDAPVAVIGGGVLGTAVAHALARRGVHAMVLEAENELALGASGTNSGILHTGFDSTPGELETLLILRSAELRPQALKELGVPVLACGGLMEPGSDADRETVRKIAEAAGANGVEVRMRDGGGLEVPGESVTDPVAYVAGLAAAAASAGAQVRTNARVAAIEGAANRLTLHLAGGERVSCGAAVNCAGLRADEVARMAGDESFQVYPRKGEFFVFEPPGGTVLKRILLPIPTKRTKGVLVFPTVDGRLIAGPTAHDQDDKDDWSVRPEAWDEVMHKVVRVHPPLEGAEPVASYAGLRPAGCGCNYVIGASAACPGLVNVAAIRSTGLSASLGIGEHVAKLLAAHGVDLGPERPLPALAPDPGREPWWLRASRRAEVTP